jgi:hypothetical protein
MTSRQIMGTNLKLSGKFKGWMEGAHTFRGLKVNEVNYLKAGQNLTRGFWSGRRVLT